MKRLTIDDLKSASSSFRQNNPALFGKAEPQKKGDALPEEKRTSKKMNKTEARFANVIGIGYKNYHVISQPTRFFPLQGGGTYTPDFLLIAKDASTDLVFEIKGGYKGAGWEHGMERYKRAAAQYHCDGLRFRMATWDSKMQSWQIDNWEDCI